MNKTKQDLADRVVYLASEIIKARPRAAADQLALLHKAIGDYIKQGPWPQPLTPPLPLGDETVYHFDQDGNYWKADDKAADEVEDELVGLLRQWDAWLENADVVPPYELISLTVTFLRDLIPVGPLPAFADVDYADPVDSLEARLVLDPDFRRQVAEELVGPVDAESAT